MATYSLILMPETPSDYREVELLTREAFWNHHGPGCDEHYLAHLLRSSDAFIRELDFVAELDGTVVGNILYAKARIALDAGGDFPVITFGPISVRPSYQRQGIGRRMIGHTLGLAGQMGYPAVFIYGDPAIYGRIGFLPAERFGVGTEDNRYHDALQAVELRPGALKHVRGRFLEGDVYHIDPAAAALYDQTFPVKEKVTGTPSQTRFQETVALHRPRV